MSHKYKIECPAHRSGHGRCKAQWDIGTCLLVAQLANKKALVTNIIDFEKLYLMRHKGAQCPQCSCFYTNT